MNFLKRDQKPDVAYIHTLGTSDLPPVVFLGGFRSDMKGTKAVFLENLCKERGQEFIRFDYSGHGKSEGKFEEGCISDWTQDALDVIEHCTSRPALLVGSSMGGWISLLIAKKYPKHVQGLIGLAAAPDFTTWMEEKMSETQKKALEAEGFFELPNDYDDSPYIITKRLIEDGRKNLLLNETLDVSIAVHLIQGKKDADVPWETAKRIKDITRTDDFKITYIDEADHRLSSPDQLEILGNALEQMSKV